MMPGVNGYELVKKIAGLNINKPKILLISGYDIDRNEIKKNTDCVMRDFEYEFLCKPFSMKELITKIKEMSEF